MAVTEVSSDLILLRLSPDTTDGTPIYTITCETDSEATLTASVSEIVTKRCGVLRSPQEPVGNITLNGVVNATPEADEASYAQLSAWMVSKTKLWIEYYNEANGTVGEGDGIYMQGLGYISDLGSQSTAGESQRFSISVAFSGQINTVQGS